MIVSEWIIKVLEYPSLGWLNPFWGFGGAKAKEKHCVLATNTTTDTTQAMPAERRLENIFSKLFKCSSL